MKITGVTIGFILMYFWLLLPEKDEVQPYPFHEQVITTQAYAEYLFTRVLLFIMALTIYQDDKRFKLIVWMFGLYVIDYILIYNDPVCYFTSEGIVKVKPTGFYVPISYYLFMGLAMIYLSYQELKSEFCDNIRDSG